MEKICIFGAGHYGQAAVKWLKEYFEIEYFIDNNVLIQGKELFGFKIRSLDYWLNHDKTVKIVIATRQYSEIESQLCSNGVNQYFILSDGLLFYHSEEYKMLPVELNTQEPYCADSYEEKSVLMVQNTPCIRTHKIAKALKDKNIKVFLLYTIFPDSDTNLDYFDIYEGIFHFFTMNGIINFVRNSDFTYVHCSNQPDILALLMNCSGKVVIHDCHDLSSEYIDMSLAELAIEHTVNQLSDGVICISDYFKKIICEKFELQDDKVFVLENYISKELYPSKRLHKLSEIDGELHCVYEGGLVDEKHKNNHRYLEHIFNNITKEKIHIHFYSQSDPIYCEELAAKNKYLHYEGNKTSKELSEIMTQYDVGLCVWNVNEGNHRYLSSVTPNKLFEYINSGLPVAVSSEVETICSLVEDNDWGMSFSLDLPILPQILKIKSIQISNDSLYEKKYTFESRIDALLEFYSLCAINSGE